MKYMSFRSDEKEEWHKYYILLKPEYQDIYLTHEYCKIYEQKGEGEAILFIYEEDSKFVYYPFLKRKLTSLKHLNTLSLDLDEYYDISTPYGYGGPISNTYDDLKFERNFYEHFQCFCMDNKIVTEFVRFHPLLNNHNFYKAAEPEYIRDTVYIDLTLSQEEIWHNYDSRNRNRIKKSRTFGLEIIHRPTNEIEDFLSLYYSTMDKNEANYYYYFNQEFFADLSTVLGKGLELVEVKYNGVTILSCFVMCSGDYLHYHFAGSHREFQNLAAGNYLIDYLVRWGKKRKMKYFHLGGGYTANDSLFHFKKKFNKKGQLPFFVGKKVHNKEIYEKIRNRINAPAKEYFPLYRDPGLFTDDKLKQILN